MESCLNFVTRSNEVFFRKFLRYQSLKKNLSTNYISQSNGTNHKDKPKLFKSQIRFLTMKVGYILNNGLLKDKEKLAVISNFNIDAN